MACKANIGHLKQYYSCALTKLGYRWVQFLVTGATNERGRNFWIQNGVYFIHPFFQYFWGVFFVYEAVKSILTLF